MKQLYRFCHRANKNSAVQIPGQDCWPSGPDWAAVDQRLGGGKLIPTTPLAAACYDGPDTDAATCESVTEGWQSATFRAAHPLGYAYPVNESCPLVTLESDTPSADCRLGGSPHYVVNVTTEEDIVQSILFAREKNLRVVVKSTGHDFLQRCSFAHDESPLRPPTAHPSLLPATTH